MYYPLESRSFPDGVICVFVLISTVLINFQETFFPTSGPKYQAGSSPSIYKLMIKKNYYTSPQNVVTTLQSI